MNVKNFFTVTVASAAILGTAGFVYAQSSTTSPNMGSTSNDGAKATATTTNGATSVSPGSMTSASSPNNSATMATPGNTSTSGMGSTTNNAMPNGSAPRTPGSGASGSPDANMPNKMGETPNRSGTMSRNSSGMGTEKPARPDRN